MVGFVTFLIVHHTNLTLKIRSGIHWEAEQNNAKLMTQNNAGSSNEGDDTPQRSGAEPSPRSSSTKKAGTKTSHSGYLGVRVIMCN